MKTISILLLSIILLNSGCATLFTGTKQKIMFKSNIEGTVYQNLTSIGKTNEEIKIRKRDFVKLYTIKSDGCIDKSIELKLKPNFVTFLNIPFYFVGLGVVFALADIATGANVKTDKIVNVDLDCKGKSKNKKIKHKIEDEE